MMLPPSLFIFCVHTTSGNFLSCQTKAVYFSRESYVADRCTVQQWLHYFMRGVTKYLRVMIHYPGHRGAVVEFPGQGPSTSRRFPVRGFSRGLWKSSTSARTAARKFYYRPSVAGVKTFLWIGEKHENYMNLLLINGSSNK